MLTNEELTELHIRAMACHCECLGMNADNMCSAVTDTPISYYGGHYYEVLKKWGLIDHNNNPTF